MRLLLPALALLAASPLSAQSRQTAQASAAGVDAFARSAAQNSLTEIMLSSLALQRSKDDRVQDYAWTMLDHHARAAGDLAEALPEGAAVLPTEPSAEQATTLRRMRQLTGAQFDQAYFTHQLDAHARAIALYDGGARLPDPKVADYARSTLPILRAHGEIARVKQAQPPRPVPGD